MSTKWHKGPPPSVGWWPTRVKRDGRWHVQTRWHNGKLWSFGVPDSYTADSAAQLSEMPTVFAVVEWRHRPASWPARSRT